jgi:hypothetical protein
VVVIRKHGLKHRMSEPTSFISQMNRLCIAMSGASRKGRGPDKSKARKQTLRSMKTVVGTVRRHAQRYVALLETSWQETTLSQAQAEHIARRMNAVLEQIPAAVKQAHERIIGERTVPNDERLLSLYEPHAQVYVRGKAGADVEFGLQLVLTETADGLIVDSFLAEKITNDVNHLFPAISRIRNAYGSQAVTGVVTDRGFASKANSQRLSDLGITDGTLPRTPSAMKAFLADPKHQALQNRRAQTEARIGIFKGSFIGDRLPVSGRVNQERYIAWATLAHNLWVLARLPQQPAVTALAS